MNLVSAAPFFRELTVQCAWRRPLADAYTAEILSRPFVSSELAAALARHLRPAEILQA
jgi:hypothetical protein